MERDIKVGSKGISKVERDTLNQKDSKLPSPNKGCRYIYIYIEIYILSANWIQPSRLMLKTKNCVFWTCEPTSILLCTSEWDELVGPLKRLNHGIFGCGKPHATFHSENDRSFSWWDFHIEVCKRLQGSKINQNTKKHVLRTALSALSCSVILFWVLQPFKIASGCSNSPLCFSGKVWWLAWTQNSDQQ